MSRYEIPPRSDLAATVTLTVVIGWDPPLQTFFAQVIDPSIWESPDDGDRDPIIVWTGTSFGEHQDLGPVIAALAPYAEVPQDLRRELEADRREDR